MKDGGPAFPQTVDSWQRGAENSAPVPDGMSLRDYFAAAALTGMLGDRLFEAQGITISQFAKDAYRYADAMLVEREKENDDPPEQPDPITRR